MVLPNELITAFVKITNDKQKTKSEVTVYGTVVHKDDRLYVRLDGSDLDTPVTSTVEVEDGERVTVLLKNHTATITGNLSSPSARIDTVRLLVGDIEGVQELIVDLVPKETFNEHVEKFETLEEKVTTLEEEKIKDLDDRVKKIREELDELKEKVETNTSDIKTLKETTIPELRNLISGLSNRVAALENASE